MPLFSRKPGKHASATPIPSPPDVLLSSYPALARISDPAWVRAVQNAAHHRIPAGAQMLPPAGNEFILVLEGVVRVYYPAQDGREITLYRMHAGDLCVLSLNSLLQKRDFHVMVQTSTDIYALGISAADFWAALGSSEAFRTYVLSELNGRLCEMMCLVQDTAFQNLNVRLACLLGRLFERAKSTTIHVTHQALAQELGTTREVVSRILKEFEQQDCIRLSRGQIVLNSESGLLGLGGSVRSVALTSAV